MKTVVIQAHQFGDGGEDARIMLRIPASQSGYYPTTISAGVWYNLFPDIEPPIGDQIIKIEIAAKVVE